MIETITIDSLYAVYYTAKRHGIYSVANIAYCAMYDMFGSQLRVQIETSDLEGSEIQQVYYDLVTFVLPSGETMCLPTPLLNSFAIGAFYKRGKVGYKLDHARKVDHLFPQQEEDTTRRLLEDLVLGPDGGCIYFDCLEILESDLRDELIELITRHTGVNPSIFYIADNECLTLSITQPQMVYYAYKIGKHNMEQIRQGDLEDAAKRVVEGSPLEWPQPEENPFARLSDDTLLTELSDHYHVLAVIRDIEPGDLNYDTLSYLIPVDFEEDPNGPSGIQAQIRDAEQDMLALQEEANRRGLLG